MTGTTQPAARDPIRTVARLVAFVFVPGDAVVLASLAVEILYPVAVALPDVDLATLGGVALVVGILGVLQLGIASVVSALLDV